MWHTFKYVSFEPPTVPARVYRPILWLEIVAGKNKFPCLGIVDTGADFCTFPMSFGLALGLNPLTQIPTQSMGAGGGRSAPTYHFDVELKIPGLGNFKVHAAFMESLNPMGLGLLGHLDFLDGMKAMFDRKGLVFHLETPDAPPTQP